MNVDDVEGGEQRDEPMVPISPTPEPGTEASTSKVAQDDDDKENSSLISNRQGPTAPPGREAALPDCGTPGALASPLKVTAYFNQLSAALVRSRITQDEYLAFRDKVDEVLEKCGYKPA